MALPIGNTHHCYLLKSLSSPAHYIGYTTNPHRRISQHNGNIKGGAVETSKNQPWKFLAILSNISNETLGLQFEWAWQNPRRSKVFRAAMRGKLAGSREMMAKRIENDKSTDGYLHRLLVLICESDYGKHQFNEGNQLDIYFFEKCFHDLFFRLMHDYRDRNAKYSDSEDDDRPPFCSSLPHHVKVHLVESVKDLPFYQNIRKQRRRSRKSSITAGDLPNCINTNISSDYNDDSDDSDASGNISDSMNFVENSKLIHNMSTEMIETSFTSMDLEVTQILTDKVTHMSLGDFSSENSSSSDSSVILLDSFDDIMHSDAKNENDDQTTPTKKRNDTNDIDLTIDLTTPDIHRGAPDSRFDDSNTTIDLCSP